MSRSNSSALSRTFWAACGLALCAVAAPLRAQTVVSTTKFSLTFPSTWMKVPLATDSAASVINLANQALSFLVGVPHAGGDLTAEELRAAMIAFGSNDSLNKTNEGAKILGGKSFSFVEFKLTDAEEGEENARYRAYFYTQGNMLFEAILGFDTVESPAAIADLETALATLAITPGAGIRRLAVRNRPLFHRSAHDVLGRSLAPLEVAHVAAPTYSRY
jgi:hypothetical protein